MSETIKIVRNVEYPPLTFNKNLWQVMRTINERSFDNMTYSCGNVQLSINKIFRGLSLSKQTTGSGNFLVVVPSVIYANLHSDMMALRRYSPNDDMITRNGIKILYGSLGEGLIVPFHDLPKGTAYAFNLKEYVLGNEETIITIDNIEIHKSKDYSSIPIEPVDFIRYTDICDY